MAQHSDSLLSAGEQQDCPAQQPFPQPSQQPSAHEQSLHTHDVQQHDAAPEFSGAEARKSSPAVETASIKAFM
ncbi:MAG: hypothetical protein JNM86_15340 [Phycisphaerae bacterium]|nr:hypothetical protein [Phycisphaerae bacterium]MBN8596164.1 hypothetical protein [Planctomycetota bacterium]